MLDLFVIISKFGDMRLNVNGYQLTVFSEFVCKYSKTLKMVMERDGLEQEIVIDLPVVKPEHVDMLFSELYRLDEGNKIDTSDIGNMDMGVDELYINMLAIDLLIEYLCIDAINVYPVCTFNDLIPMFINAQPYKPNTHDDNENECRINTTNFMDEMYDIELDKNESELDRWKEAYNRAYKAEPIPRFVESFAVLTDKITVEALDAALNCSRADNYLFSLLRSSSLPGNEKVAYWYEVVTRADKAFEKWIEKYRKDW